MTRVDVTKDFTYVNLESGLPRIGDCVAAVGNPYGLGGTVTVGIVSAERRDFGSDPYDNYIQIDVPINKGNSGGPTFTRYVVEVTSAASIPRSIRHPETPSASALKYRLRP
jgi:S1-C subfamily serine protease